MNYKLDTDRQVFFYEQEFYVLSNFSAFMVIMNDRLFPTSEHAYHWHKFPHDPLKQKAIGSAMSAHLAYDMAQRWRTYVRPDWVAVRVAVMRDHCAQDHAA